MKSKEEITRKLNLDDCDLWWSIDDNVYKAMDEYAKEVAISAIRFCRTNRVANQLLNRQAVMEDGCVASNEEIFELYKKENNEQRLNT